MGPLLARLKDRPGIAAALLCLGVACHLLLGRRWPQLDPSDDASRSGDLAAIYIDFAGVAAIVASFAGVIVVFASLAGPAWSHVRTLGGKALLRNWVSPLRVSLAAALISTLAALLQESGHPRPAWWAFEIAVCLTVSAGLRVLWLLRGLLEVQAGIDQVEVRERRRPTLVDLGLQEPPNPDER